MPPRAGQVRDNLGPKQISKVLQRLAAAPDLAALAACGGDADSVDATLAIPGNVPRQARELRQLVQGLQAALCRGWALFLPLLASPPAGSSSSSSSSSSGSSSAEAVRMDAVSAVEPAQRSLLLLLSTDGSSGELSAQLCLEPSFLEPLSATAAGVARGLDDSSRRTAGPPPWSCWLAQALLVLWLWVLRAAEPEQAVIAHVTSHVLHAAGGVMWLALAVLRLGARVADARQPFGCDTWREAASHALSCGDVSLDLLYRFARRPAPSVQPGIHWSELLLREVALQAAAVAWLDQAATNEHAAGGSSSSCSSRQPGGAVLQLPPHAEALRLALGGPSLQLLAGSTAQRVRRPDAVFAPLLVAATSVMSIGGGGAAPDPQAPGLHLASALVCAVAERVVQLLAQDQAEGARSGAGGSSDAAAELLLAAGYVLTWLTSSCAGGSGAAPQQQLATAAEQATSACLPMLLHQLAPALWLELCSRREQQALQDERWLGPATGLLLVTSSTAVERPNLLPLLRAALRARARTLLPLLEWAVRASARQAVPGQQGMAADMAYQCMDMLACASRPSCPGGRGRAWLAAVASDPARSRELLALAVSCLKTRQADAACATHVPCWASQLALNLLGPVLDEVANVMSSSSSSGGGSSSSGPRWRRDWPGLLGSPLVPWLVLAARGLQARSCCLVQQAGSRQPQAADAEGLMHACVVLEQALRALAAQRPLGTASEAEAASVAAHAAALAQLAEQAAGVKARLEQLRAALGSAGPASNSALELAKQAAGEAQALAAGVLGELPLPLCCNNPACSNMAQHSEAALVGGGTCACGGCRMARFCCRACQTAAWPRHKRVCKQLAAERQAAGPGLPAVASQLPPIVR